MTMPSSPRRRIALRGPMDARTAKSTGYLLGAQFLRNLGPLVILLLLARLTDPETVGVYSLALAIVTPYFVLAQLGMRTVTLTLQPEASFRNYAIVQTGSIALALIAAVVVGVISTPQLAVILGLASCLKIADAFSDFLSGPLQRHGRSVTVFTSSLISATVVSIIAGIVLFATRDLVPTLAALAGASLLAAYVLLFRPAKRLSRSVEAARPPKAAGFRAEARRIFSAGLPLGMSMALMSLISTVPLYVVTASFGEAETARLAVLLYVYALADIVTGVVSQAWIPHAQEQLRAISLRPSILAISRRGAAVWTVVYIPVTVIGLVLASWLIPILFGAAYRLTLAEAIPLGIAVVLLPSAHFMATAVAIQNQYVHALTLSVGSTVLSLAACVLLIPPLGIAGAFWALAIAVGARAAIAAIIVATRTGGRRAP
ncbi:oligosaccharide flippase family protein [Microbacterium sp. HD4P20]|uniref:lipopolysaccharide biosynthesis protein n=1 Tax=Microbacterium sp. HD4P20 TaxID=2864874 RepID=UPI0020A3F1FB|nr:oligosaccharide flippase family protein [Microbacterium sp. HD4P20]MCP2637519.1 oligosaccharide flippase family protein [Microbacterium sp. HD4P20]